jgi:hypothetical protein
MEDENADKPQMILGAYVRVEIEGSELDDVISISRTALHDESSIWIMQSDNTLDVRMVDIVWSNNDSVYVMNSLNDGELIVTSDLSTPVQGMSLRLDDTKPYKPVEDISMEKGE